MTGTPQANPLGSTYAPTPSQYIQMLPQTQQSMSHHTLQTDASQLASGIGVQRTLTQTLHSNTATSSKQYYWS